MLTDDELFILITERFTMDELLELMNIDVAEFLTVWSGWCDEDRRLKLIMALDCAD